MGKNLKKIVQSEQDVQEEESDEEVALDEDDVEEAVLDEDAIPKQKVEIDNTVRLSWPSTMTPCSTFFTIGRPSSNTRDHPARPFITMDRNIGCVFPRNHRGRRRR